MADYPVLAATLAALDAVKSTPTDAEAASKLGQVDVQTRTWVADYLKTKFDITTEKLLPAVVDAATSLNGLVSGSTSNAGTQRQIVQGTVSDVDLRDSAVTTNKIANNAVTTGKIAALQITTGLIADDQVTAAKIAHGVIDTVHLAANAVDATIIENDAVTTDKILAANVTAAKIAANVIGSDQLVKGTAVGQILVTGADPYKFAVKTMSGGATISAEGVVTLLSANQCQLVERQNNNIACGAASATTWHVRGDLTNWVEAWRASTSSFASFDADGKITLPVGTYIIEASAPAYKVDKHISRLVRYNSSNVAQETYYGTSEYASAGGSDETRTHVSAKITVAAATDYIQFEHYCTSAEAADGLGVASNSGGTYEVYAVMRIEQIA